MLEYKITSITWTLYLTLTMLNPEIPCFENSGYPNQLASEKPADQDPHFFPLSHCYKYMLKTV